MKNIKEKGGKESMYSEKKQQIIEKIKNMTDKEADILEVFIVGFRAGKQTIEKELEGSVSCKSVERTA